MALLATLITGFCIGVIAVYVSVPNGVASVEQKNVLKNALRSWYVKTLFDVGYTIRNFEAYQGFDPLSLIKMQNAGDVKNLRVSLTEFLFPEERRIPVTDYPEVELGNLEEVIPNLQFASGYKKLTHRQAYGFRTTSILFEPKNSSDCIMIFHAGHKADVWTASKLQNAGLQNGCLVATMFMPLESPLDPSPVIRDPSLGPIRIASHYDLSLLNGIDPPFEVVQLFIRPVIQMINYAISDRGISNIYMVGFSGGGWIATLAAAIDTRIDKIVSIAGGLPQYLRLDPRISPAMRTDFEMSNGTLYREANLIQQYVLAATPNDRHFLQVLVHEGAIFNGKYADIYSDAIKSFLADCDDCSGDFELVTDKTVNEHSFSPWAESYVIEHLFGSPRTAQN